MKTPQYDFNDPVFRMNLKYKRWAREHIQLSTLQSDVIECNVAETVSPLKVPIVYHVRYRFKSIVGIDEAQHPIYHDDHLLELTLPEQYPIEGCKLRMLTDVWHPNIRSEGKFKGRVCGNTDSFGLTYDLYQLVLRVGEILQWKNYHAIQDVWPYPEDSGVAEWVLNFAEPNGIVNKSLEKAVDDTPLLRTVDAPPPNASVTEVLDKERDIELETAPPDAPAPPPRMEAEPQPPEAPAPNEDSDGPKIKIGTRRPSAEVKTKITITPKG